MEKSPVAPRLQHQHSNNDWTSMTRCIVVIYTRNEQPRVLVIYSIDSSALKSAKYSSQFDNLMI